MKPVYGYHGKGVSALDFVDGVHRFTTDLSLSLRDVFKKILAENPDRYILQKVIQSSSYCGIYGEYSFAKLAFDYLS